MVTSQLGLLLEEFDSLHKSAFQPIPPGGQGGGMMPPGGGMMPPGGGMMPPGGGMPMDPAMMQGGGMMPPPPPGPAAPPPPPPPAPGGMPPEALQQFEGVLSEIVTGLEQLAMVGEQTRADNDAMAQEIAGLKQQLLESNVRLEQLEKAMKDAAPAMGAVAPDPGPMPAGSAMVPGGVPPQAGMM